MLHILYDIFLAYKRVLFENMTYEKTYVAIFDTRIFPIYITYKNGFNTIYHSKRLEL